MKRIGVADKLIKTYRMVPKTFIEWECAMYGKVSEVYGDQLSSWRVESFFPLETSIRETHFSRAVSSIVRLSNTQKLKENK